MIPTNPVEVCVRSPYKLDLFWSAQLGIHGLECRVLRVPSVQSCINPLFPVSKQPTLLNRINPTSSLVVEVITL